MEFYEKNPKGHVWKKNEDGDVDIFAFSIGIHNGPECILCGLSFCQHCEEEIEPCEGSQEDINKEDKNVTPN